MSAYQRLCQRLAEDLGADPGQQLRELHLSMLRREPGLAEGRASAPVPRQLPGAPACFAGRENALARLEQVLAVGDGECVGVRICCVSGMAGVGKTALAVHWAHRVADRFPDGQLYVNLRGFDPGGVPVRPAEALRRLLDALDVPAERIPDDLDAQVAAYRSHMAGRRMLVVLDNARDIEQVRPLLPGSSASMVLVTSRDQLAGLVAVEGAVPVALDLLTPAEAYELLVDRLSAARVAAEPRAAEEIIVRCGRLPLALAVAAARVAGRAGFPLAVVADELRDAMRRLDVLDGGHPVSDVRAALAWSYRELRPAAARLLRLLALHRGPDISARAAASLAGVSVRLGHVLLAELQRAHLVDEDSPGRYGLHDLVRLYVGELATAEESDADRRAALHRVLDHYVHTGNTAASLLNPNRRALATLATAAAGVTVEELDGSGQALAWFTAERAVLLTTIREAAAHGFDTHAWRLAWTLTHFFHRQGHWHDQLESQHTALAAGQRLADRAAQASSHRHLGRTYARLGRSAEAHSHLLDALDLFAQLGNRVGQGYAHRGLCLVLQQQERHQEALEHSRQALELFRAAGHEEGEASSLNGIGWYYATLGDHPQAIAYCQQAIALFQRIENRGMEGTAWDSLGYAHHRAGDPLAAIRCYQRALELLRETGEHFYQAESLLRIADSYRAVGDHVSARDATRQALAILERLGHQDADKIRANLHAATEEEANPSPNATATADDHDHGRRSPLQAALP
jgi:tetratricopeptide (TPR) repeat protein